MGTASKRWISLLGFFALWSAASVAREPLELGKTEKAWQQYLEHSDSEGALALFEREAEKASPAPMELLGRAAILDSRERLAEAQTAYGRTLQAVWKEIEGLSPKFIEALQSIESAGLIPQGDEDWENSLHRALWLWNIGSFALHAGNKIAPYRAEPDAFIQQLQAITGDAPPASSQALPRSVEEKVPAWPGFHQLRAEARTVLMVKLRERGRLEEAEALSKRLGFLRDFLWIGPFPNKEESGYGEIYPPEEEFDPYGQYEGKLEQVSWTPLRPQPAWGYVDLKALVEPPDDSTTYALTFIYSDEERPIGVELGHAGAAKLWLVGQWVVDADAYHDPWPFQVRAKAQLERGWNPVLLKLCSKQPEHYGFFLRLTTPEGAPLVPSGEQDAPMRFWKSDEPLPMVTFGWPVREGATAPEDWLRQRLQDFTRREREALPAALAHWLAAGSLHFHQTLDEHSTEGIDLLRAAEALYPRSSLIQYWIGRMEPDANRSRQAYLKAAQLDPRDVQALSELGRHYLSQPYKDRALEVLEEALARNPDSPRLWFLKGERLARLGSSEALAREAFERGAQLCPHYYYGYYRLAETQEEFLPLEERLALLEKALEADRVVKEVRQALLQACLQAGQVERALQLAEEGVAVDPYDSRWYAQLARHARAAEDWQQANELIGRALALTPDSATVNRLAGEIYHAQGKDEEARAAWQRALTLRPNTPELEEYLTTVYEDTDDYYPPYRIDLAALPEIQAEDYPEAKVVILLDQMVQKVYANGASSYTIHLIRRALTDSGVQELRAHRIAFEPEREKVRIKRARVIRADGSVYDAPRPTIHSARGSAASRLYGDYSVQILSFPAVDKGSTVDLEYEVQQTGRNIYVDYFGSQFYFGQFDPMVLTEYVLITPIERTFYTKMLQPDERYRLPEFLRIDSLPEDRAESGDFFYERQGEAERVWVWNFTQRPQIPREPNMPSLSELVPYVKVSTFASWDEMARWYWDLIQDQFLLNEELRAKTAELVQAYADRAARSEPSLTDLDIIKALNSFVNTQVRYLGLEFGIHGYKPHRAVDIFSAQYGDCKDKATLMLAMAAEKGIPGRIALVRTSHLGRVDYELPSLGLFNHAIVYFPDVDGRSFVLDGTAQFHGTTELPSGDQGVTLLTIGPGGGYEFVESPIYSADINQATYETDLVLAADGAATGVRRSRFQGLFNPSVRSVYENRGKVKEKVEAQFGSAFPGTTVANIELSDLDNFEEPEWIRFELNIPKLADRPAGQDNRLVFRPVLFPLELSRSYAVLPQRRHELVLQYNWSRIRKVEVMLPEGFQVAQLPESRQIESPFGFLELDCRAEGGKIIFEERVGLQVEDLRVPTSEYEAFREFCVQVDQAEEQPIILERASG